jgi:lysophospholipase L1-like esterase
MLEKFSRPWSVSGAVPALSRVIGRLRSSLGHSAGKDSRQAANPWIVDYEKLGLIWQPYVMRLCRPNQKTASVATDSVGFRVARYHGREVPYAEYRERTDTSVLLGNSAAFGVGASSDDSSLGNQLAVITDRPWYNLSGRASNVMQDVFSLLLFGASKHRDIVLMSGVNDLLFALHFERPKRYLPTFWGDDRFASLNECDAGNLADAITSSVEERYELALEGVDRALLILGRHGRGNQTRVLFALQPLLAWIDKPLHPNEAAACAEWNAITSGFRATHRPESIGPWKERFARDVRVSCERHGLGFIDLNTQPELLTAEHLFVDRIHLTDRGQRLVAESVARWLHDSAERAMAARLKNGSKAAGVFEPGSEA